MSPRRFSFPESGGAGGRPMKFARKSDGPSGVDRAKPVYSENDRMLLPQRIAVTREIIWRNIPFPS